MSEKKIVHRDIAARNVLGFRHEQVKIADFGLARVMETDMIYQIKTNRPLPAKWMAPEAFENEEFTVYSDM